MRWRQVSAAVGAGILAWSMGTFVAQAQGDKASAADKRFVKDAMQGGMAEVQLGQLASDKGNSGDVKEFGQKMVHDHTELNDQMKQVAGQVGVTPPESVTPMDKALETKLKALSGDDFDKAYIRAMVKDHRKDLMDFKKEASTGSSSTVKDAANKGSQVIAEHFKMAKDMAKSHGLSPAKSSGGGGKASSMQ